LCAATKAGQVFSCAGCSARGHTASQWLDLADGRLRLDRLSRNGGGTTFFPWPHHPTGKAPLGTPVRPFLAGAKKVAPPPSSAALRPARPKASGCVVDRLRPADRHRGRGGRGLETAKET